MQHSDCEAKYDAEVELHKRKQIAYTVVRPGHLTTEPAAGKGVKMGRTHIGSTRLVDHSLGFAPGSFCHLLGDSYAAHVQIMAAQL